MRLRVIAFLCSALAAISCSTGATAVENRGTGLWGTTWRPVEVGMSRTPPPVNPPPFLRFNPDGRLAGSSGVNSLSASVNVAGKSLRLERVSSTRRSGPPELMHFERELMRALELTSFYRISGSELILRDRAGKPLARFVAEPQPAQSAPAASRPPNG